MAVAEQSGCSMAGRPALGSATEAVTEAARSRSLLRSLAQTWERDPQLWASGTTVAMGWTAEPVPSVGDYVRTPAGQVAIVSSRHGWQDRELHVQIMHPQSTGTQAAAAMLANGWEQA